MNDWRDTDHGYQPDHDEIVATLRAHLLSLSHRDRSRWYREATDDDLALFAEAFDVDAIRAAVQAVVRVCLDLAAAAEADRLAS